MIRRRTWILSEGALTVPMLGPMKRVIEIAQQARIAGSEPHLLLEKQTSETSFEGFAVSPLVPSRLQAIHSGDAIVVSAHLHPRNLNAFLKRGIPFDVDLYNIDPYEHLETSHANTHPLRVFQSRRRTARRYRLLLERAEKFYLSNTQQLNFLGGMLFARGDADSCRLASRLPERCAFLPMGSPTQTVSPSIAPYPAELHDRPIFLWGGGIWSWFDVDTLLQAFKILDARASTAALFFLTSGNPSGNKAHDQPARSAVESAIRLDLLNKNVFFANEMIGAQELPGYLAHCHAGIMANPNRLESYGSWRTRLLDLLPYGKPVISAGFDPLSHELEHSGACLSVPADDAQALAQAIETFCNVNVYSSYSEAARRCSSIHNWDSRFATWRERILSPHSFITPPKSLPLSEIVAFLLGL